MGAEYFLRSDHRRPLLLPGREDHHLWRLHAPSASSVSEDVGASSKAMHEPRLVDVSRVEPARFIDDPTFCDEYLPGGEPNRDYGLDVPERLTEPPVYCAAIGCKSGAPSWLRSS